VLFFKKSRPGDVLVEGLKKKAKLEDLKGKFRDSNDGTQGELSLGLENIYNDALEDIARDKQEQKACKADDAAVPEYLWEEHLLNGLKEQQWDNTKLQKVRRLSKWLRSKMLCWWKRNVTFSYIKWAAEKYELTDVTTTIDWVSWDGTRYE
jgi:hypothetical protein